MWTKRDKQKVCAAIDCVAAKLPGGKAELARQLNVESRAVVNNWRSRGAIPIDYLRPFIEIAKPELTLTPAMLHPDARLVDQATGASNEQQ